MRAAGVPDASPGPLGHGRGSMKWKRGYDGKFWAAMTDFNCIKRRYVEKRHLGGIFGHLGALMGALMGAAGVLDVRPGPLGCEGGSTMQKRRSDGNFWAAMT